MPNYFDQFDQPAGAGNYFDQFDEGSQPAKKSRLDVPKMTIGSVAQDIASGVLQIGPTAVKGVADIARLATGDSVGADTSAAMERGMESIRDTVGSDRAAAQRANFQADMADDEVGIGETLARNKGALADQLLPTIGSMFLPVGVAGAAGKLATAGKAAQALGKAAMVARVAKAQQAAGIGAVAAQNAADTFAQLLEKGASMEDAYLGAGITVPFSVIAGRLTGGGAEGAITRALTGGAAAKAGVKQVGTAMLKEGGQEMGEEAGQIAGQAVAMGEAPSVMSAAKQLAVAGTLGAAMGGGVDVATQAGQFGKPADVSPAATPPNQAITPPNQEIYPAQSEDGQSDGVNNPAQTKQPAASDPTVRLAELEILSEQRELTPAEQLETAQLLTTLQDEQDAPQRTEGVAPEAPPVEVAETEGGDGAAADGVPAEPVAPEAEAAGVEPADVPVSVDATGKQASWVIRDKATGEAVMETFDLAKVQALNRDRYEAVPIVDHLASLSQTAQPVSKPAEPVGLSTQLQQEDANGDNTQGPTVPAGSQAVDAGAAPVDAGQQGATAGPAGPGAVDVAGQPEQTQPLSRETMAQIQSGVASLDPDMRDLWALQLQRKLEKRGALQWTDIPQELAGSLDTVSFGGLKAALQQNPSQAIDLVRGAPAVGATPEAAIAETQQPAPADFWSFAKSKGFTPGQIKIGTPQHAALKAEYDALKAGKPAPTLAPAPTPTPSPAPAPVVEPLAPPVPILPPMQPQQDVNLQNRDRGRAASVVQMSEIARNPDYMRLGPSRTPDSGAPMVFAVGDQLDRIAPEAFGREDVAVMSDGQRVPFRYAVVDASKVNPSNFADGRQNPEFNSAAPGTIKALNNGRTAGVRAAHEMGTAGEYVSGLQSDAALHGVPADVIARTPSPMLVRVYSDGQNTAGMAAKSQGQGLGMSPAELARQDAPLMDSSVLGVYEPGEVTSAGNRDFTRAFIGKLQGAGQDVAGMMTGDGQLSQDGRKRIQAALMQAAYGDSDIVEEMFDSTDTDIKAIGEALKSVAGQWANMRDSAKLGAINPQVDITQNLLQAIGLIRKARRDNSMVFDLVNQPDLMTGEAPDATTVSVLRLMYSGQYMTRAVGKDKLAKSLSDYVASAMVTTADPGMFGNVVTPLDILAVIIGQTTEGQGNAETQPQEGGRQPAGGDIAGIGASQGEQGIGRPVPGEGRAGPDQDSRGQSGQNAKAQARQQAGQGGEGSEKGDAATASRAGAQQPGTDAAQAQPASVSAPAFAAGDAVAWGTGDKRKTGVVVRAPSGKEPATVRADGGDKVFSVKAEKLERVEPKTAGQPKKPATSKATRPAPQEQAGPLLTAPTEADIVARQDAAEAAQRKEEAADRAAKQQAEQDEDRKRIAQASVRAADTFELGQDPLDSLTGQQSMFDAPQEPDKPVVRANTVFTEDAAAAARARLKKKLGQLNSGIDPEMMMDGLTLAGYHIEKGARTFAAYARAMLADLGEGAKPYLKSWYMGVKYDPRATNFTGMDNAAAVDTADIDALMAQESSDVPRTDAGLEPDRQKPATEPAVGNAVSADTGGNARKAGGTGGQASGEGRSGQSRGDGVPVGSTTVGGERSDFSLPGGNATVDSADVATGSDFSERGSDIGLDGVRDDPIPATQVDAAATTGTDKLTKLDRQRAADKAPVKSGDLENVRATLPYLLEGQQEDVKRTEDRFAQPDGYGMLFTNGTGTGKTFTGLGVVKRMQRQGKTNTLIVVPDDKIAADWVASGVPLGLKLTKLADTKSAGSGIVLTTYANLGQNDSLASRSWDLVVADESHELMKSADGKVTTYLASLRAITHHPDGADQRYQMQNRADIDRLAKVRKQIGANDKIMGNTDTMAEMVDSLKRENAKLSAEEAALKAKLDAARTRVKEEVASMQGTKRARLLALSATPFAYEFTIDWANGYLFDYAEGQTDESKEFRGYNQGSNRDRFFMQHFGYSMRHNKLTKPDPSKVDTGLLQRTFNGWLRKKGALSARMLDVPADYDRRFVLVDSAIGNQIDDALNFISESTREGENKNGFSALREVIDQKFDYLSRRYLLEAIKATEVVPIVRQHMALGRKVVVFHDYKKGGGFNPFNIEVPGKAPDDYPPELLPDFEAYKAALTEFRAKFKGLVNAPLGQLPSPIAVFKREFPEVLLVNGDEKKADLLGRYKRFQDDASGPQVMLVQSAKNKGWSGHDTTGKHQRVLINLGQPTAPTLAIQQEGRIYRTGQVTDAPMRYLNTGTNWEKWAFATTIAGRASTAENLGMGEQARALKDSFIAAFEESDAYPPGHEGEGKGGKERDKLANAAISAYDRAKTYYWATQKKTSKTKAQEGVDYFATPEPVGFKMAEWLGLRGGESSLEPSGGHGAIARWLPEVTKRTVIEPSNVLRARLAMAMDISKDRLIDGRFEDYAIVNKHDGIAMNPPFGVGGKTAIEHLAKAATHLRDGGRIVALIPTGPTADKRFDQWMHGTEEREVKPLAQVDYGMGPQDIYRGDTIKSRASWAPQGVVMRKNSSGGFWVKVEGRAGETTVSAESIVSHARTGPRAQTVRPADGIYTVGEIRLPQVTFERAGTAVATRIVILEKQSDKEKAPNARSPIDLTGITDIKELFDRIEDISMPPRAMTPEQEQAARAEQADTKARQEEEKPKTTKAPKAANPEAVGTVDRAGAEIVEHVTQKGKTLRGIVRDDLRKEEAQEIDPFTFRKNGGWFIRDVYLKGDDAPMMSRTRSDVRAARAALAKIMQNGVTSPDDLRDLLRVPGYSQWAQSTIAGDMAGAAALRDELRSAFPGADWKAPRLNDQGIINFYPDWAGFSADGISRLTRIADRYDAPVAVRGGAMHPSSSQARLLRDFGFEQYLGAQERSERLHGVMFGMIRPAGGITATTPLFDRNEKSTGLPASTVQQVADTIAARWTQAPTIIVVPNMQDMRVPQGARSEDARQREGGATGVPRGFYHRGTVYLVADGLKSVRDAAETLFHEALGHYGLRAVFGSDLNGILDQIADARMDLMRPKAVEYGKDLKDVKQRREVAEEVLAEMAQTKPNLGYVKRAIAAIRTWLRKNVPALKDMALTDAEIINSFILPARGFVERGQMAMQPGSRVALSRSAMKSVTANMDRGLAALAKAVTEKTTVHRAMFRNGLGWVDFVWGDEGAVKPDGRTKGGRGLSHVVEARMRKDSLNEGQAINVLAEMVRAIAAGTETKRTEVAGSVAAKIEHDGYRVALVKNPGANAWVITAFEIGPDARPAGYAAAAPTQSNASLSRNGLGAGPVAPGDSVPSLDRATRGDSTGRGGTAGAGSDSIVAQDGSGGNSMFSRSTLGNTQPQTPQTPFQKLKAKALALTSPEAIDSLIYELQDKNIDLKRLRDHIKELGGTITDLNDAYLGEELYHKRVAKRTQDFLSEELKPLLADLRARGLDLPTLEQFLHARHAPEANRVLAERNPNAQMIDTGRTKAAQDVKALEVQLQRAKAQGTATKAIEQALDMAREELGRWTGAQAFKGTEDERLSLSGMSDAESSAFMSSLPAGQRVHLDALAARVDAMNAKTLDTLGKYGLMDQTSLDAWRNTYQHYVPLHRDEAHPDAVGHPVGQGFSTKGDAGKRRTGSNEKVTNILAHIAMQREAALTRGEKNRVAKKLYLMAAQNPDPEVWAVDKPPMTRTVDRETGFVRSSVDPTYKNKPNVVMVRIAGRDQAIVFNERNPTAVRMAQSIKSADLGDLNAFDSIMGKATRWLASVNTQYNPVFGIINFARDVQAAVLQLSTTALAGQERAVAAHVPAALRGIYAEVRSRRKGQGRGTGDWAKLWEDMQDEGGTTGYRELFIDPKERVKALESELKALDRGEVKQAFFAVVDWLSDYNETMENAVRLSAYKVALEQGMSKERAASLAKNLTVNFNRRGRQTAKLGVYYAFLNAAIQGTTRMAETLRGPMGKKIMLGGVMLGAVNALLAMTVMGAGEDDDEYAKIPDFVKERSIIIPLGSQDYLAIPMPLGYHVLPNMGRKAVEMMLHNDPTVGAGTHVAEMARLVLDAFNPLGGSSNMGQMLSPTPFDPAIALMQNRDSTGKPIYREDSSGLDPTPGHTRTKDSASWISRHLSELLVKATGGTDYQPGAINWTPDQIDYIVGQLTGGVGRELMKVETTLTSPFNGDELPPHKIPLVGRVYGNTRGPASESEKFYENLTKLNGVERELKGRARDGQDVGEYMAEEPMAALVGMGNAAENQLSKLRQYRREVVRQGLPGYQSEVRDINAQIGDVMKSVNQEVRRAKLAQTE